MAQAKARSLDDDDDDPTWRPLHAESMCAQRREVALCIVPVSPQDWRVVEFGHQEVQNVTVGVLQHKQFSVSGRRRSGVWLSWRGPEAPNPADTGANLDRNLALPNF